MPSRLADAGHRRGAAATGAGHEEHLAGHAVGVHLVDGAGLPLGCGSGRRSGGRRSPQSRSVSLQLATVATCEVVWSAAAPRQRGGAGVRRGGVAAGLPGLAWSAQTHTRWEAVVVDDGTPDRSGDDRRRVGRPRAADPRRAHRQRRPGRGPQRGAAPRRAATTSPSWTPTTSLPPARAGPLVASLEASGSDFVTGLGGALGGRRAVRAAVDAPPAPPAAGRRARPRPPRDPRRRLRVEQAVPPSFWDAAGPDRGRRASATRTSRPPRAPTSPAPSTCSPDVVYHWRIRTDGSSITQQRASVPRPASTAGRPSG